MSPWPGWNKKGLIWLDIPNYDSNYRELNREPCALIPEGTVSICRWLSNHLVANGKSNPADLLPLKVFYILNCFRNEPLQDLTERKFREFKQIGLESLGPSCLESDMEVICIITGVIESFGVPRQSILVRFSDIRLFDRLCQKENISGGDKIALKEDLDNLAEKRALGERGGILTLSSQIVSRLRQLGVGGSGLEKWKRLFLYTHKDGDRLLEFAGEEDQSVADSLRRLGDLLEEFDVPGQFDPCVVRSHEYYTHTVFETDVVVNGKTFLEVAGGGRYNRIVQNMSNNQLIVPATGFAYGLERLLLVTKEIYSVRPLEGGAVRYWLSPKSADLVVFSTSPTTALEVARGLRSPSQRVDVYTYDTDRDRAQRYARRIGADFREV